MGVIFYPRGGSAQVIRYLAAALVRAGWDTELLCGSLGEPGERTHAETFYRGMQLSAADYSSGAPMHPSFEDRPGAPDRVLARVTPEAGEELAGFWEAMARSAFAIPPDVLHLHHLTPLHEGCIRALPDVPLVTQLHGTELKMIGRAPQEAWPHAEHWIGAMRRWAARSDGVLVISPHDREVAERLLGVDPGRVTWIPNGVDLARFDRLDLDPPERLGRWRRWLVEEPQGWREGGEPGSVRYSEADLAPFAHEDAVVLLFVGRFTEVKRIPLLVRAYARARERFEHPAPLVIWGGFPGEWEGEHPHTVAERERVPGVYFLGWRGHAELNEGLACSEVMVMPSIDESFGQVFVEAMACGVPVIAANAGGPPSFVNVEELRPNGWLVEPDSHHALAEALVTAVNDVDARAERARNGYVSARRDFSWETQAERVAAAYEQALAVRRARGS
jgi:glycosyltransferase involved in cell wall biosynthesis